MKRCLGCFGFLLIKIDWYNWIFKKFLKRKKKDNFGISCNISDKYMVLLNVFKNGIDFSRF